MTIFTRHIKLSIFLKFQSQFLLHNSGWLCLFCTQVFLFAQSRLAQNSSKASFAHKSSKTNGSPTTFVLTKSYFPAPRRRIPGGCFFELSQLKVRLCNNKQ